MFDLAVLGLLPVAGDTPPAGVPNPILNFNIGYEFTQIYHITGLHFIAGGRTPISASAVAVSAAVTFDTTSFSNVTDITMTLDFGPGSISPSDNYTLTITFSDATTASNNLAVG